MNQRECPVCRKWITVDRQTGEMMPHPVACPTCGDKIPCGGQPHKTIERVVKPHQIFAGKHAGERVAVEVDHVDHPSVVKATVSIEEHEAEEAAKNAPPPSAEEGPKEVARLTKQAREDWLRRKKQHEHSAKRAADKAVEAAKADEVA